MTDNLEVRRAQPHEGGCNFCLERTHIIFVTRSEGGGLIVRFCLDCVIELIAKVKRMDG